MIWNFRAKLTHFYDLIWPTSAKQWYAGTCWLFLCSNPHIREGCDIGWLYQYYNSEKFQSTHPWRMWRYPWTWYRLLHHFNPHIHEGCDYVAAALLERANLISIHTSTKDVTHSNIWMLCLQLHFNPHIHEGCDGLKKNTHICSARSLCSTNRFLPNLFLSSSLRLTMLKALFQRQRNGSVHFMFDCNCQESV